MNHTKGGDKMQRLNEPTGAEEPVCPGDQYICSPIDICIIDWDPCQGIDICGIDQPQNND
jgi:hypothetical protein